MLVWVNLRSQPSRGSRRWACAPDPRRDAGKTPRTWCVCQGLAPAAAAADLDSHQKPALRTPAKHRESRSQQWLGQPRHLVVTHACDCSSEWVPSEWESDKNITAHQSITKHLEKTKDETCVQSVFRASMCPEVIQFNVSRRWERRGVLNSGQRYGNELWLGGNQSECRIPPLESMNAAL